ncbi:MAG: hypothetical protein IKP50_03880 [Bacilli bacterium]|nr:hypothetical protein [Bacilli bacterium]
MGRLDIYISNKGTSEQALDNSAANGGIAPESKANNSSTNGMARTIAASAITHSIVNAGINNAKSIIQNQISIYGDVTGDYIKQTNMEQTYNNIMNGAGMLLNVGTSFMVHPVVGLINFGLQGINMGVQEWQRQKQYSIEYARSNAIANYNSVRLGEKLVDGNRNR